MGRLALFRTFRLDDDTDVLDRMMRVGLLLRPPVACLRHPGAVSLKGLGGYTNTDHVPAILFSDSRVIGGELCL